MNRQSFQPFRAHHSTRRNTALAVLTGGCVLVFGCIAIVLLVNSSSTASVQPVVVTRHADPEIKMVDVLVPTEDIGAGQPLSDMMFRLERRPAISVPPTGVTSLEEVKGFYARTLMVAGQPVVREHLSKTRPVNAITANIPEGYRGVTISVDARTGVEGWARPGAHVDVLWTSKLAGEQNISLITSNARVLSAERQIDTNVQAGVPVPSTVTLLVSAADANKIQLAQTSGVLSLALRGDNDSGQADRGANYRVSDLVQGAKPTQKARPEAVVKIREADGQVTELVMQRGRLIPADME